MFKPKHVPIKLDISLGWFCKVTISTSRKSLSNFDVMQKNDKERIKEKRNIYIKLFKYFCSHLFL